jgi:hypothetical protein
MVINPQKVLSENIGISRRNNYRKCPTIDPNVGGEGGGAPAKNHNTF